MPRPKARKTRSPFPGPLLQAILMRVGTTGRRYAGPCRQRIHKRSKKICTVYYGSSELAATQVGRKAVLEELAVPQLDPRTSTAEYRCQITRDIHNQVKALQHGYPG